MAALTFIVPAHNAADTLSETLDSIISQTYTDWHVIVVDDGSSDDTVAVCAPYLADSRFDLYRKKQGGVASARNLGASFANTTWIVFLDSDDLIDPQFAQKMLNATSSDQNAKIVLCAGRRMTPGGILTGFDAPPDGNFSEVLRTYNPFYTHTVMMDLQLFRNSGGYSVDLQTCEDWDLWVRLFENDPATVIVNEPLTVYRMRPTSLTRNTASLLECTRQVIKLAHRGLLGRETEVEIEKRISFALQRAAFWIFSVSVGRGVPDLNALDDIAGPGLPEKEIGYFLHGISVGACAPTNDFPLLLGSYGSEVLKAIAAASDVKNEYPWVEFSKQMLALAEPAEDPCKVFDILLRRHPSRVLMIVAHPDDEVIGAGAHLGSWPDVSVVYVTDGSPLDAEYAMTAGFADRKNYGRARLSESQAAMSIVGVSADRLKCLGFVDQELSHNLVAVCQAIENVLVEFKPDVVVTHPYEGGHPDHDAVCFAVHQACAALATKGSYPSIVELTSYFENAGTRAVSQFLQGEASAVKVRLSPWQRAIKQAMYSAFASQAELLKEFPVEQECFRMAPRYDFSALPAAEMFYDRFDLGTSSGQWLELAAQARARMARFDPRWKTETPCVGDVDFGDFARPKPISRYFGYDRGTPIDRPYIEQFLEQHRTDIFGRVLEVGDNAYTVKFGGPRVTHSDVLHIKAGAPGATIIGDLTNAPHIPDAIFDCVILTQVLVVIFDLGAALETVHRILKPGGVVLITVPGITNVDYGEWRDQWMWSFTTNSMNQLLTAQFLPENIAVSSRGNVFTATAFLQGLSMEDIAPHGYGEDDPQYQLTVMARAKRSDRK